MTKKMKIAISSDSGIVSPHFGRAPEFTLVTIENNQLVEKKRLHAIELIYEYLGRQAQTGPDRWYNANERMECVFVLTLNKLCNSSGLFQSAINENIGRVYGHWKLLDSARQAFSRLLLNHESDS